MNEFLIALASGVAGWYLSQFSMLASEDAAVINGYIDEVEACSRAVEKYWLTATLSKEEETTLASIVRARYAALSVFYGEAPSYLREHHLQNYHVLQVRFFGIGTGGTFEGRDRKIDPERAIESYRLSREIVQVLRLARREQLSPQHWISLGILRLKRRIYSINRQAV